MAKNTSLWNSDWKSAITKSSLPMLLSTSVHTSLLLLLAMFITVDTPEHSGSIPLEFAAAQETSLDDCTPLEVGEALQEIGEPARLSGLNSDQLSLDDGAADGVDIRTLLASMSTKTESREVATDLQSTKTGKAETRKQSLHPVHVPNANASVENSTIRFGGSRLPGSRHVGFANSQPLEVIVPGLDPYGANVLNQASSLSLTGGAMMVSTARPHASLSSTPLQLEYDPSNIDGNRLTVIAGEQRAILSTYDWELLPLARFVDAGHHGAISIHMFGKHEKVSLDAAFEQTLLGLRFIQADMMPRGIIMSQDYLPQDSKGILLGPGEQERLSPDHVVRDAVQDLESLMSRTRNGAPYSVLTDARVQFEFEIIGSELVISGSPYFFFWEPANKGDQVIPKRALNDSLKRAWPKIKLANPVVIEAMERSFRAVAFFRFQKQSAPNNWGRLMEQLSAIRLEKVPTPLIALRRIVFLGCTCRVRLGCLTRVVARTARSSQFPHFLARVLTRAVKHRGWRILGKRDLPPGATFMPVYGPNISIPLTMLRVLSNRTSSVMSKRWKYNMSKVHR